MLQKERTWIFIEISGFLLQIFSASIYLAFQQMRGIFGKSIYQHLHRHTTDALGYYIEEIHWFNLIFVTICIHIISIMSNLTSYNQTSE